MALKRHLRESLSRRMPMRERRGEARSLAVSPKLQFHGAKTISSSEWAIYRAAIHALRSANIPFLLAGGFALATFTGRWRDTKDIDFYIRPTDRKKAVAALARAGVTDYFRRLRYDRK